MASGGSFYQLPDELLLQIFTYLDMRDLVLNVQHVNSHWKAIVQNGSFWKDYVFTIDAKRSDKKVILLLKNMPCLRALTAKRVTSNELIRTAYNHCKFLTYLELYVNDNVSIDYLRNIAKHLPHLQHLGLPLSWSDSKNASEYSTVIQQFHKLLSLNLIGCTFETDKTFLSPIAKECPLLHEINLGGHDFNMEDVISFLEAKKTVITKFFCRFRYSAQLMLVLDTCKRMEALHFGYNGKPLPSTLSLDLPKLKHLEMKYYDTQSFPIFIGHFQKTTMLHLLKLDLSSCMLEEVQFETVLKQSVNLKSLVLGSFILQNGDDFQHIGKCTNLEHLEIPHTAVTDVAVEIFSAKCTKLNHLDIGYCPNITDHSLSCLKKCTALKVLKLNRTHLTGQNFHLLALHQAKLRELYIQECYQLECEYVKSLQEEMPQIQVYVK